MSKILTYEEFTDLNIDGNLTDFILYLQDRGVIKFEEHVRVFNTNIQKLIADMQKDWLEVAKDELKERNEYILSQETDVCSVCGTPIEKERLRCDEDNNILCEDCFIEYLAPKE